MNRGEIRTAILRGSEHNPQSSTYDAWVNNLINDSYAEIMSEAQWPFCEKTVRMTVRRDKTKARMSGNQQATATSGSTGVAVRYVSPNDERQVLELDGHEYEILEVDPDAATILYVGEPFLSATGSYDFTLRHRDYFLPPDCADILDVEFRNVPRDGNQSDGKIDGIPQSRDAIANLDLTTTCDVPACYHSISDLVMPTPETPLVLSSAAATPSVPSMTHYFTYVYEVGDADERLWSSPAPAASIVTAGNEQITITFPTTRTGLRKRLLWGELESDGSYTWYPVSGSVWLTSRNAYQALSTEIALNNPLSAEYRYKNIVDRYEDTGGTLRRIRFWPRPDGSDVEQSDGDDLEERFFFIRYLRKPAKLVKDTDTPLLPPEHHRLLVDRVLVDVFQRLKDRVSSDNHQKKYRERLRILRGRYGSQQDIISQKEMRWGRSRGRSRRDFQGADFTVYIRKYQ